MIGSASQLTQNRRRATIKGAQDMEGFSMLRTTLMASAAAIACAIAAFTAFEAGAPATAAEGIPNFMPDNATGWVLDRSNHDDLLPTGSGPGPVTFDKAHPYIPNGRGPQPTYRVAALSTRFFSPGPGSR
jgi:hypothetical protein